DREAVRRVLDVGALEHLAAHLHRGADAELRVRRVGLALRGGGARLERVSPLGGLGAVGGRHGASSPSATSVPRIASSRVSNVARTRAAVWVTSSCDSAWPVIPAAWLVMHEMPITRAPMCRATHTSGTVDIPTASAPSSCSILTSAGVS